MHCVSAYNTIQPPCVAVANDDDDDAMLITEERLRLFCASPQNHSTIVLYTSSKSRIPIRVRGDMEMCVPHTPMLTEALHE